MIGRMIKKIIVREIAELVYDVRTEISAVSVRDGDHLGDESVISIITEIGNKDELLDGEVIARRQFGFSGECRS